MYTAPCMCKELSFQSLQKEPSRCGITMLHSYAHCRQPLEVDDKIPTSFLLSIFFHFLAFVSQIKKTFYV